jgi:hypothetical protein
MTPSEITALVTMEAGMVRVRAGDTPPLDRWYVDHLGVRRYTSARGWSASYAPSGLVVWPMLSGAATKFCNLFAAANHTRQIVDARLKCDSLGVWDTPEPVASGTFGEYAFLRPKNGAYESVFLWKDAGPDRWEILGAGRSVSGKSAETKGATDPIDPALRDLEKDVLVVAHNDRPP